MSVSSTSCSAPIRTATWAARKSLSPKEISSVAVVSFSLMTGSTRQSSSVRQRLARVEVVGAGAHVEEREQHLRAGHAAFAQQLVVDAVELALPDGAGGLQLADRASAAGRSSITRIPRAIAPLVTITTSSPCWCSAGEQRRRCAPSSSVRSAPSPSATTLEPSLTTIRLMRGDFPLPGGGAPLPRVELEDHARDLDLVPGLEALLLERLITPMLRRRSSRWASASSLSRSKRASSRSMPRPRTAKAFSPAVRST